MKNIITILIIIFSVFGQAQEKIDSLKNALEDADTAKEKFIVMNRITAYWLNKNLDKAEKNALQTLNISPKDYENLAYTYILLSKVTQKQAKLNKALEYALQSLKINREYGSKIDIAKSYLLVANLYLIQGRMKESKENMTKSYEMFQEEDFYRGQVQSLQSLAKLYIKETKYSLALEDLLKAQIIAEEQDLEIEIAKTQNMIGYVYILSKRYQKAFPYLNEAGKVFQKKGKKSELAENKGNLAKVFFYQRKYSKALREALEAEKLAENLKDLEVLEKNALSLAHIYKAQKNYDLAYQFLAKHLLLKDSIFNKETLHTLEQVNEDFQIAQKQEQIDLLAKDRLITKKENQKWQIIYYAMALALILVLVIAVILYRNNKQKQATNSVLWGKNEEIKLKNQDLKILNTELTQQSEEIISQRDAIEVQNKALQKAKTSMEVQKSEIEAQKQNLEKQNQKVTASINYASRIQEAMLPRTELISQALPEHFIFFKPRDIVSGDFYWFAQVQIKAKLSGVRHSVAGARAKTLTKETKDKHTANEYFKTIISAIDCTGHGVPGAFMSMIGNQMLNEIVIKKGIYEADEILNRLHKGIKTALKQDRTNNNDGMDMSLCVIDPRRKILEFAGAKNPLFLIQEGKIKEIKANSFGIGGSQPPTQRVFRKHTFSLQKPTYIYIFSDGFPDQIGGKKARKFMKKRFRELVFEIHRENMQTQKQILETTFANWIFTDNDSSFMGKQLDDVLVIGAKLDFNENY